ncbi:AgmX/PglI C-terminal domain-containing protein [Myxococcota bacterium]|nr:AgmX/PglI C-terminal domain-containing protein [Myxococcota bacterium]
MRALLIALSLFSSVALAKLSEVQVKGLLQIAAEPAPTAQPIADAKMLKMAREVKTAPGDLPHLKIELNGKQYPLPLKHTKVLAELVGDLARVEVRQIYDNPLPEPIEAIYVFPLPENSAVDDMEIRIEDRIIRAEIQKRAQARATYEAAKAAGHTAALLEQERPNVFTQSIANLAPGKQIEIKINYVQRLTYEAGEYEFAFPMVVGPRFIPGAAKGKKGTGWSMDTDEVSDASRITPPIAGGGERTGHDIELEVVVDTGLPLVDLETPTHEVDARVDDGVLHVKLKESEKLPNRDFVMRYRLEGENARATLQTHKKGDTGYFSLLIEPPKLNVKKLVGDRELIFVVDISGSMHGRPLSLCKAAMREAISKLQPADTFNIYTFSGITAKAFPTPRPANDTNIKQALDFILKAQAGGGTRLGDAVKEALSPEVEAGRNRYVFFLTDGYVGNENGIFSGAQALVQALKAKGQKARVFGFGAGSSTNRHLIDGLAKSGDGLAVYATNREDPTRAVDQFYGYIDHTVLKDIVIDWGDLKVDSVQPAPMPSLFATRPLVLSGRYTQAGEGTIYIRAKHDDKPYTLPIKIKLPQEEAAHEALATLWARAQIEAHERVLWDGHDQKVVNAITELGLAHRIVTAYTSFVAVDQSTKVKGQARTVLQPGEAPEDVNMAMAGPAAVAHARPQALANLSHSVQAEGLAYGMGGLGMRGSGMGGGGLGSGVGAGPRGRSDVAYGKGRKGGESAKSQARPPRIVTGQPMVHGSLDKEIIRRVIRRHHNAIKHAYLEQLQKDPNFKGKIVVKFTINQDGRVIFAEIESSTFKKGPLFEAFKAKLLNRIQRWRFPKPQGGGVVVVSYPFIFNPS